MFKSIFSFIVLSLLFFSCSSDKNNETSEEVALNAKLPIMVVTGFGDGRFQRGVINILEVHTKVSKFTDP